MTWLFLMDYIKQNQILIYFILFMRLDLCCKDCKSSPVNVSLSVHIEPVSVDSISINHLCCPWKLYFSSLCLLQLVDEEKSAVMTEMEKLVALCQQLQMGAKTPVQGKTATFQKVPSLRLCVCVFFLFWGLCALVLKMNHQLVFAPESVILE